MDKIQRWANSRQGKCSLALAVIVAVAASAQSSAGPLDAPFIALLLVPVTALVVRFAARAWEVRTWPGAPSFSRSRGLAARQLREDPNAYVFTDHGGFLFERRYFFVGTGCRPTRMSPELAAHLSEICGVEPVQVAATHERNYWAYEQLYYWENAGYSPRDIMALVHHRKRREERHLQHATTLLDHEQGGQVPSQRRRQPIPRVVKHAVFRRDDGRCVECGSNFDIQYDHVIPFSMGGSSTVENLQLLCAACNQSKGARL